MRHFTRQKYKINIFYNSTFIQNLMEIGDKQVPIYR